MLQSFRNVFKSKIGLGLTIGFIGLIGVAFAVGDVASTGSMGGGITGGDNVAVVGDEKISANELSQAASLAVDQLRQQEPTLSLQAFVEQNGLDEVLDQLLDRRAISWWAAEHGIRVGSNLINSEIRRIPAFAGPGGQFSEAAYQAALVQRKLTDAEVRRDLGDALVAQQVLVPGSFGARMPVKVAARYAALTKERREGAIATIPSAAFAPTGAPTAAQLTAYYNANRGDYIRPERRVLRYATFGAEALGNIEPTSAEVSARYNRDRAAKYAARELRSFTQLIVPTKAAADAIAARGGAALETAARETGLQPSKIENVDKTTFAGNTSQAVANAAFAAGRGAIATPARGGLGFYVVRVDAIDNTPARSLDQARTEIVAALREEKRVQGLADLAAEVEGQIDDGGSLTDIAKSLEVEVSTTKPIVADGRVYGVPGETAPAVLAPALAAAFEMEEGEPQIAAIPGTDQYLVFETARITPSAAAPLAEIRDDATAGWRREAGQKAAKAAADRIVARVAKGQTLAAAMAAEKVALPAMDSVNMTRGELVQQGQRVPPPLALLFSMAKDSVKRLEAPRDAGWFVVALDEIEPGKIAADDPLLAQASRAFSEMLGREYGDAMRAAIRKEAEIERNADAIAAVRRQLTGTSAN
ncbi:Peptidyl-prolyl cis-trans isomerase D [Tsuneonella dongtanensis]|uniref:Parvulin-like PPIase n=1 Tax=Tsuneonella dongtanensis TaxID=692370 RepID=A0A1B2AF99_9SPHN|nr:peptidylprolyl isomerase [Tsuneonella dongtanensis]ANY20705.1 Peptidyl-prolyl cis-trans isomerase D [Tsuneonella dongtanensis]